MVEIISFNIDDSVCGWYKHPHAENSFYPHNNTKSPFPILDFCLLNDSGKTLILKAIYGKSTRFDRGLSGKPTDEPRVLEPLDAYDLWLDSSLEYSVCEPRNKIEILDSRAIRFQVRLLIKNNGESNWSYIPNEPMSVQFRFGFSSNLTIEGPLILLNTLDNPSGKGLTLMVLD